MAGALEELVRVDRLVRYRAHAVVDARVRVARSPLASFSAVQRRALTSICIPRVSKVVLLNLTALELHHVT